MGNVAEVLNERSLVLEALDNFAVLLDDSDFSALLEPMRIGRLQFLRRKQMLQELRGLHIALWRLALARSFPNAADAMFEEFLVRYVREHPGKPADAVAARAREYWGMLEPAGDTDFHAIARHLTSFLIKDHQDTRAITLKLALRIRSAYSFIFGRLI